MAIEYSVLSPVLLGKWYFYNNHELPPLSDLAGAVMTKQLRGVVASGSYDPADSLGKRLVEALCRDGLPAVVEPVTRGPPGGTGSLSRDDLPPQPKGRYLLNVVIESIGLVPASRPTRVEPAFVLRWQVFSPTGGMVVPARRYIHGLVPSGQTRPVHSTPNCGLGEFGSAIKHPEQIWSCFDSAFDDAGTNLAGEVRAATDKAM